MDSSINVDNVTKMPMERHFGSDPIGSPSGGLPNPLNSLNSATSKTNDHDSDGVACSAVTNDSSSSTSSSSSDSSGALPCSPSSSSSTSPPARDPITSKVGGDGKGGKGGVKVDVPRPFVRGGSALGSSIKALRGKPPSVVAAHVGGGEGGSRNDNISGVVQKAKKAATSLFCILHAQTCCDHRCDKVRGCHETKKILLHMKQCSVGPNFPCSTPGCNQVRKLMAHYRRCRDLRRRASPNKPHHCLVCSLLAREVKNFQEQMEARVKSSSGGISSNSNHGVKMNIPVKVRGGQRVSYGTKQIKVMSKAKHLRPYVVVYSTHSNSTNAYLCTRRLPHGCRRVGRWPQTRP